MNKDESRDAAANEAARAISRKDSFNELGVLEKK